MATEAQVEANRVNAQKSTGPRTAEGKAVVAQNAVKHGLLARVDVIRGEDQAEFDLQREALLGELVPVGVEESMLAERIVGLSWRLQRVACLQNEVFDALLAGTSSPLGRLAQSLPPQGAAGAEDGQEQGDLTRGQAVLQDFSSGRVLDRLLMHEQRIERSLYKATAELRHLQLSRAMGQPTPAAMPRVGRAGGGGAVRGERSCVPEEVGRGRPTSSTIAPGGLPWGTRNDVAASVQAAMDELRKTNPIRSGPDERQLAYGKGVEVNSLESECRETKPISAPGSRTSSISPARLCGCL